MEPILKTSSPGAPSGLLFVALGLSKRQLKIYRDVGSPWDAHFPPTIYEFTKRETPFWGVLFDPFTDTHVTSHR